MLNVKKPLNPELMTPEELYELLNRKYPGNTTIICDLHSTCCPKRGHRCKISQKYEVVNFDQVKTGHVKGTRKQYSSVDAVAVSASKEKFCFIELKSWQELWTHEGTVKAINAKADKYKNSLPKKLTDSMIICITETEAADLFTKSPAIFVLVTDIDVNRQPLESLAFNLNALAGTSSDWVVLCNDLSQGILKNIDCVPTYYKQCRDFDAFIKSL